MRLILLLLFTSVIPLQAGTQEKLEDVKYFLINGQADRAFYELKRLKPQKEDHKLSQLYYLALTHFIRGNYTDSLQLLQSSDLKKGFFHSQLCWLSFSNQLLLGEKDSLDSSLKSCQQVLHHTAPSDYLWASTLTTFQTNSSAVVFPQALPLVNETVLAIWLKLALYLNQQAEVLKRVPFLPQFAYEDTTVRELLGFLYYENQQFQKAYQFVEDLNSANAETLKGSILFNQKKYEQAYQSLTLALEKRPTSLNALERSFFLTLALKKKKAGLELLQRLKPFLEPAVFHALKAYLLLPHPALKEVELIPEEQRKTSLKLAQLALQHNLLTLGNDGQSALWASRLCQQQNKMGCWLLLHLHLWKDFSARLTQENLIQPIFSWDLSIDPVPLSDKAYLSQQEISSLESI